VLYSQQVNSITNALLYQLSYPGMLIYKAFPVLRRGKLSRCVAFCASFWSCAVQNMAHAYYMGSPLAGVMCSLAFAPGRRALDPQAASRR
jgi:hypothetical protein